MAVKLVVRWRPLAFAGIVLLALGLRCYGLNWDMGNSFHPDERQILFHVTALGWPSSFAQFLDAERSPLNPHFFAYGSFPLYLLAFIGSLLSHISPTLTTFANLTLVGRVLSALFDTGSVFLTGLLALRLVRDDAPGRPLAWSVALLASAFVAFTPLQLQLSHFYAVDTLLLFFVLLTLLGCVALLQTERVLAWSALTALGFGLALATKFSAAPLALPIFLAFCIRWYRRRNLSAELIPLLFTALLTLLIFVWAQPYALLDRQNFIQQVAEQGSLVRGDLDLPYVRQFAGTLPFLYQGQNMLFWGLGLTLGLGALAGFLWSLWLIWRRESSGPWLIVLSWILIYTAITGSFYVKFMRYMLPIYPLLALLAATFLVTFSQRITISGAAERVKRFRPFIQRSLLFLFLVGTIFQGLALLNVYSQPNTRVQASRWLYQHVSQGSVLTYEQWDDPLPVAVDGYSPASFTQLTYMVDGQAANGLDLYGDDTLQKAQRLAELLPQVDVLTMPTDRLDKSIPRLPERYPLTINYYRLLFSGELGFHLAAQFNNPPHLLGITLDDSNADESYSVFDHPTARIFVRENPYPYTTQQLYQKLLQGIQLPR